MLFFPTQISCRLRWPHPQTQRILILTFEKSCVRPLHKNQVDIVQVHWNEVIFDNPNNNEIRVILHWNQVQFDHPHWNQVNLNRLHQVQVSPFTLIFQAIFAPRSNPSRFRPPTQQNQTHPPHRNEVNLDHLPKNKVNFPAHPKTSDFRPAFV